MFFIFAILFFLSPLFFLYWLIFGKNASLSSSKRSTFQTVEFPQHTISIFLAIGLAFQVIFYDVLVSNMAEAPVLGVALFNTVFVACLSFMLKDKMRRQPLLAIPLVMSIIVGFSSVLRANGFVQSVNTVTLFAVSWFMLAIYSIQAIQPQGLWIIRKLFALIPQWFAQLFKFSNTAAVSKQKSAINFQSFIKTLLITCGVLLLFTILLMNADPVFADKASEILEQGLGRTVTGIFVLMITAVLISLQVHYSDEKSEPVRFFAVHDLLVPMIAIAGLFGFFIAIQLQYLFAGKGDLTSLNLTYSEYVRKGFLELLVTAFLGGLFVYIAAVKTIISDQLKRVQWLRVASSIVVLELFFLLASALKRDLMYVDVYGLTRVRIVGGMFIAWLAVLFISLLALLFVKKMKEKAFLNTIVIASAVVVLALNLFNIDEFVIAGKPAHHTYTDYFYIANLSEDSAEHWEKTIQAISTDTSQLLAKPELTEIERAQLAGLKLSLIALQERRTELFLQYVSEQELLQNNKTFGLYINPDKPELPKVVRDKRMWQNYNYAEDQAFKRMNTNKQLYFEVVDQTLDSINEYQEQKAINLYKEESRLLFDFSYPFISINLSYYPTDLYSDDYYNNNEDYSPLSPFPSPTFVSSPLPVSPVPANR